MRASSYDDVRLALRIAEEHAEDALAGAPLPEELRATMITQQARAMLAGHASAAPRARFFFADFGDVPVARMVLDRREDALCIVDIATLRAHRGRGAGKALLEAAFREACSLGMPLTLHVLRHAPALTWYLANGFRVVGERDLHVCMRRAADRSTQVRSRVTPSATLHSSPS